MRRNAISLTKVEGPEGRAEAISVIERVYLAEKGWLRDASAELPLSKEPSGNRSWFLARVGGDPAGVIRLSYDPPLEIPPELDFHFEQGVDLARLRQGGRFVEVGRFMILPEYRSRIGVALKLMGAAVGEVVERGYTHFITDVFEGDPHSPLAFHTRVLGFQRIGSHRFGELSSDRRRIVLVLDIAATYLRLRERKDRVFRELTGGLSELLEGLLLRRRLELAP
ncbi:MAG TPA: GNAT family N-acetyltransferase [Thermoanaerobaculia bacterium]|nr:GNAT family N-acetyltransferase [Thermoanaerobaculia bacterium]